MGSAVKLFHIIAQLTVIMCNHQISKATAAPCIHVIDMLQFTLNRQFTADTLLCLVLQFKN